MAEQHDFLNPKCTARRIDIYIPRRAVLKAITREIPNFHGIVLDVGCGRMPYKSLFFQPGSRVKKYIGLDLPNNEYGKPDLEWDGKTIPMDNASADCVIATEVFEHCPQPEVVMKEILRVLKPGGFMYFTVPFLWPLHCSPYDEYRYTPFALKRHLTNSGFTSINIRASGGWDAAMGQMIGLWIRRRSARGWRRSLKSLMARVAVPLVVWLEKIDDPPDAYTDQLMPIGLNGTATKPAA
jgi:SAM-dependent methyltransferase